MSFNIYLTKTQIKKITDGKNIRVKYDELISQGKNITLSFNNAKATNRLIKALNAGKGLTLNAKDFDMLDISSGGSIKSDFKAFGKAFKKRANNVGKKLKQIGSDAYERTKADLVEKANQALDDAENDLVERANNLANRAEYNATRMGDEVISTAQRKANQAVGDVHSFLNKEMDDTADVLHEKLSGAGLRKGRFQKGSKEAKAHMQKLRALRAIKGGNVWSDLGNSLKKTAYKVGDNIKDNGRKLVYKAGDELKKQGTEFVNNELKNVLRQTAQNMTDGGISALKSVANYVLPASDIALAPAFDRLQNLADRKINNQIDKINVGKGLKRYPANFRDVNKVSKTVINPYSNEQVHPHIMYGRGFIQV